MELDSIALQKKIKGLTSDQVVSRLNETEPDYRKLDNAWRMVGSNMPRKSLDRYNIVIWERRLLQQRLFDLKKCQVCGSSTHSECV